MKKNHLVRTVLLVAVTSAGLWAARQTPESIARSLLEPLLESARDSPEEGSAILPILRGLAEDGSVSLTEERRSRVMAGTGFSVILWDFLPVRAEVYRAIGRLATPEAISYLEGISAEDFGPEEVHALWPAARIAWMDAKLAREPTWGEKARLVEDAISSEDHDAIVHSKLTSWAANELCDNGVLPSLAVVENLYEEWSGAASRDKSHFCELRMRAVASNPDRITAIGSVLRVTDGLADDQLTRWAIRELTEMKSPRADDVMERFEQEVLALPDGSPQKRELMPYADAIRRRNGMFPPRSRESEGR